MGRRHCQFDCEGNACLGTLDEAAGTVGLLIVSGGNEIRCGTWNGQALLAARLAAAGYPVFRFDRRGIGDSAGTNRGFRGSGPDIAAALTAFRTVAPQLQRIVALGNCDGATALALTSGAGCDGLLLSNPWTIEPEAEPALPPAAIRAHYARRLRDPAALWRALRGRIALGALVRSLWQATRAAPPPSSLTTSFHTGLAAFPGPVKLLIAGNDRTAQVFLAGWNRDDPRLELCPEASHSFVEPAARAWLERKVLEMLAAVADQAGTAGSRAAAKARSAR